MVSFYMKQKVFSLTDRYKFFDEDKRVRYHCIGKFLSLSRTKKLYDTNANKHLYTLKRKVFSFLPTYFLLEAGGKQVAKIRKRLSFLKQKLDVSSADGDMLIEGNVWAHDFHVSSNNRHVLDVHKKLIAWGDTYEINIHDEAKAPFYLGLVVMIDDCLHNRKQRHQ